MINVLLFLVVGTVSPATSAEKETQKQAGTGHRDRDGQLARLISLISLSWHLSGSSLLTLNAVIYSNTTQC